MNTKTTRVLRISARIIDLGGESHLIGFLTDVTEQQRLKKQAQIAQDRLRAVLSFQAEIVFHQDLDLRYTWIANPVGFSCEDIVGRNDEEILGFRAAAPPTGFSR